MARRVVLGPADSVAAAGGACRGRAGFALCDDGSATTFDPYADVVCAALDGCDDDVVIVAHSLDGATGTLVADRRPVRHLVYLCAVVPDVGRSLVDQFANEPHMVNPDWGKG